ncbi:16S rRNA methyltransferase [Methanothrix sp.]|uniref:16S rRNA methyltransferase n=1 Tax=Methanothrix sp. TaxID=90426 RepID=UPI0034E1C8CC
MISMLLADSELELVPKEIVGYPAVRLNAKKRNKSPAKSLLDASLHHSAMRALPMGDRRGRPDIVHIFLLVALESVLNRMGQLRVCIHTRNNEMITIDPATRIPKNYPRFVGLMESLFEAGSVPDREPLLVMHRDRDIDACIREMPHEKVVLLSPDGRRVRLSDHVRGCDGALFILGGFPKGDFISDVRSQADDTISIYGESLPVWTVASEILVNYENHVLETEQ